MLRGLIVRRVSLDCGRSCVRSMVASKQTIEIGIGCVSDKHVVLARGVAKTAWIGVMIMCPSGKT